MDAIKKKMEKLAKETAAAEARVDHFEEIKAVNEAEAEKFEEQLRIVLKKMQGMEAQFDCCIEDLFKISNFLHILMSGRILMNIRSVLTNFV